MSEKELGRKKLSEEERILNKRMKRIRKAERHHRSETQLVLWSYPKMLLVKMIAPWKWRLNYYSATKFKATGAQLTLSERGKGKREVLHRSESRILQLEKGCMAASEELMGKGLAENYAVRIVVKKRRL